MPPAQNCALVHQQGQRCLPAFLLNIDLSTRPGLASGEASNLDYNHDGLRIALVGQKEP